MGIYGIPMKCCRDDDGDAAEFHVALAAICPVAIHLDIDLADDISLSASLEMLQWFIIR